MARRRGTVVGGGAAALILTLFAGRWLSVFLSDRWWARAVDPAAVDFLTRWHLTGLLLQLATILFAAGWFVLQLLLVTGSIGTVQVPRRLGDLEIRELLPPGQLRVGAIAVGAVLGIVVGAGGIALRPLLLQGWYGTSFGVTDPILGADLGIYVVQLPLWSFLLDLAGRLVWIALVAAVLCHLAVGGFRFGRGGMAMTDAARVQIGLLAGATLLLAAFGEWLGPLRAVAGLERAALAGLVPVTRWTVGGAWAVASGCVMAWALRPRPVLLLFGLVLWVTTGLLTRVVAPTLPLGTPVPVEEGRRVAALASGLESLRQERAPMEGEPALPPRVGLWDPQSLSLLLDAGGGHLLAASPTLVMHGGGSVPAWLAVRETPEGAEVVVVADDRLAPGGAPVTFRDQDPADYPGVVSWRHLDASMILPGRGDTVTTDSTGATPLGAPWRRIILAWGSQTPSILGAAPAEASLRWRVAPRERVAALLPAASWGDPRPVLSDGALVWVVEGWLTAEGAPLAPAIPWGGGTVRYARPAFLGVVDATDGHTQLYLAPGSDSLAHTWSEIGAGALLPADSLPPSVRALTTSDLALAVQGWALQHGPFGLAPSSPGSADSLLPRPTHLWDSLGPVPQLALETRTAAGRPASRLDGILVGGVGASRLIRWPEGTAPHRARLLEGQWERFASYERLQDSVTTAGGRILAAPVRYEVGAKGTLAVQVRYAVSPTGIPTLAWVDLARGERLGAARTPATAWANLRGESAPLVPAPDLPDPLAEARHWAAQADSLLRAGDLEGFGRAFGALKRVLGTP